MGSGWKLASYLKFSTCYDFETSFFSSSGFLSPGGHPHPLYDGGRGLNFLLTLWELESSSLSSSSITSESLLITAGFAFGFTLLLVSYGSSSANWALI